MNLRIHGEFAGSYSLISIFAATDRTCRAKISAYAASGTFLIINHSEILDHPNGFMQTFSFTDFAADTAVFADQTNSFAGSMRRTAYIIVLAGRPEPNQLIRADLCAESAGITQCRLDIGNSVADRNGVIRADLGTVAVPDAAVRTQLAAAEMFFCGTTGGNSVIFIFVLGGITVSAAGEHSDFRRDRYGFGFHGLRNHRRSLIPAGFTEMTGGVFLYNRCGIITAAGISAGAAVGVRQETVDLRDPLIL